MKKVSFLILLLSCVFAEKTTHYPLRLDLAAFYHNRDDFFGEVDLLLPFVQSEDKLFFGNIRGVDFARAKWEGNFGLGFRFIHRDWLYGLFTFYDRKKTNHAKFFNQITFGVEAKTERFTFDANGYLPVGKKTKRVAAFDQVELVEGLNNFKNILFVQGAEVALYGFDAEIGYEILRGMALFGGGFYFHRKTAPTLTGPMGRIELWIDTTKAFRISLFDKIKFEGGFTYDQVRKTRFYTGIRLTWLLGESKRRLPQGLKRRMVEYIRRDYNVITEDNSKQSKTLLTKQNGAPVNIRIVNSKLDFDIAVAENADVVAVQGNIAAPTTITLTNSNLYVTGGKYIFNGDMSIQLSTGGSFTGSDTLFVLAGKNYTFRDLTFSTPNDKYVFTNSSQAGNVLIESNTFSSPAIHFTGKSKSNFDIEVISNTFTVPLLEKTTVLFDMDPNSQITIPLVYNNTFTSNASTSDQNAMLEFETVKPDTFVNVGSVKQNTFNAPAQISNFSALAFGSGEDATAGSSIIQVEEVVDNQFSFNAEAPLSNITLLEFANALILNLPSTSTINVGKVNNNHFQMQNYISSNAILIANVGGAATKPFTINIKELLHNNIEYNTDSSNGITIVNEATSNATITIGKDGGFFGNKFITPDITTNNIRIQNASIDTKTLTEIIINRRNDNLSDANHDATVLKDGDNIVIKAR